MGSRGPLPKDPALRQRRNARPAGRTLSTEEQSADREVPELPPGPEGGWHPEAARWWDTAWRSPMASEWLAADMRGGLIRLLDLWHAWWSATTGAERMEFAKELRLQETGFGLSPLDRKRLEWEIDRREDAAPVPEDRRTVAAPDPATDPRSVLRIG